MKSVLFLILLLTGLFGTLPAELRNSVTFNSLTGTEFNITFTFDKEYECGQYANGDWFVVVDTATNKVVISGISPNYINGMNGWTVNPSMQNRQPYDNRMRMTFDVTLIPGLPYDAPGGESIVKAASIPASQPSCQYCVRYAAVLTVLPQAPADPSIEFRPPFAGDYKPAFYTTDLRTELLPSLTPTPNAIPKASAENQVKVMRMDYSSSYAMPDSKPIDASPGWGADMARADAQVFLWLCLNQPLADKMPALIGLVQYGIDLYGARKSLGTDWVHGGGGNGAGRLLPFTFAATMLNSQEIRDELARAETYLEYGNTFWEVEMFKRSLRTGEVYWGNWSPHVSEELYWECLAVDPDLARTIRDPYQYIDGTGFPGLSYQGNTSLPTKYMALVLHLIPELQTDWPETSIKIIDYADRWTERGVAVQKDPCAPAPALTAAEWDVKESHGYRITWGPDPNNPGECICDTDSSDGQGRFPELDGSYINSEGFIADRRSTFGEEMWDAYRDLYSPVKSPVRAQAPAVTGNIKVRGNPVKSIIIVQAEQVVSLHLMTLAGKEAASVKKAYSLDVRTVGSGIYLLQVRTETEEQVLRVVKCE